MKDKDLICEVSVTSKEKLQEIKDSIYDDETVENLSQIFKAIGDPTRLKIIYVLSKSPLCVCDIAMLLDMSQSSISHHLRTLRNLNLVKFKKDGKLVIYSLDDNHVFRLFEEGLEHIKHHND